jgi:hypothetical protein
MTGVWITLAIGIFAMIYDYHSATKPDENDRHKRKRELTPTHKRLLRDMFVGTLALAAFVWWVTNRDWS